MNRTHLIVCLGIVMLMTAGAAHAQGEGQPEDQRAAAARDVERREAVAARERERSEAREREGVAAREDVAARERERGEARERQAAAARERERGRESGLPRELASVAEDLGLTAEQRAAATALTRELQTALAAWESQYRSQMAELRTASAAARQSGDREAVRDIESRVRPALAERQRLERDCHERTMALLTPEQRLEYGGLMALQNPEFRQVVASLELTPDEQAALNEKQKAAGIALAKWELANSDTLHKLEEQMAALDAQLRPLREEHERLAAEARTVVMSALTPEQKTTVAVERLRSQVSGLGRAVQLSDEQQAAVRTLCAQLVQEAGPEIADNPRAVGMLRDKLIAAVREKILTDAQRGQLPDRR